MILSAQSIRKRNILTPFCERTNHNGLSYGLSHAGYDVRLAQTLVLSNGMFKLGSTMEYFDMPNDVIGMVHDKSTWARRGLSLFNTVIEPGWRGYLTLELVNTSSDCIILTHGTPIAQIVFMQLDEPTEHPYNGKYQNQEAGAQPARYEGAE